MQSDEERKRRLLREVNERIRLVTANFAVTDGNLELVCECGASGCTELLR